MFGRFNFMHLKLRFDPIPLAICFYQLICDICDLSKMAPTILFVPGYWEKASVFGPTFSLLAADGFMNETTVLVSTGTTLPGNPSMKDHFSAVRKQIQHLVSRGDKVLLVLHSAGGFIGSEAMEH